ncbi:replicative DNA helicase [Rhodococcoides fascians]|uniref:replicative DNA helicase n=1 Tax=Rhodococcoides fascians TaxID=1828 RepID=UPI0012D2E890|nr:DnaB-like helicase C-terminal domain-containing protein [Rhodococcus fascians]
MTDEPPNDPTEPMPLWDEDTERAILGAAITEPDSAPQLADITNEAFFRPDHRVLHATITDMVNTGQPIDETTLITRVRTLHAGHSATNLPQLILSLVGTGFGASISFHAETLHNLHRARTLVATGQKLIHQAGLAAALRDNEALEHATATAQKTLENDHQPTETTTTYTDALENWMRWYETPTDETAVIPTPWPELNDILAGGLHPGRTYIIAGRPGTGKSIAGLNIAAHAAEQGHPTSLFSLEMDTTECMSRILAAGARAEYSQVTRRTLDAYNSAAIQEYMDTHPNLPLHIHDTPYITIETIRKHLTHAVKHGHQLAVIDYLQILQLTDPKTTRNEGIAHISRTLKVTAKNLHIPLVTLAQLNRSNTRENRPPTAADLRESGSIEQDADVIILLEHVPADNGDPTGLLTVHIPKNRTGRTGKIELPWRPHRQLIGT